MCLQPFKTGICRWHIIMTASLGRSLQVFMLRNPTLSLRADRSPQPQGPTNQVRCDTERNRDHGDFKQAFDRVQAEDPRAAYSTDLSK